MLRRLLGKVESGRYGRALAGLQAGWQWECEVRREERFEGLVLYGSKRYRVAIERRGTRYAARCSCDDAVARGVLCKHIAFAAMAELATAVVASSVHRQLQELG
ncbi:SWIM zinc finger family protein [Desulfoscipio gibsoniae]|uniref:SWIM zinc finger-containing protein n=1 Tax=Desulfoscipio gibsoniae DSM 7213 TaxID=767817 RepID=R4KPK3_9FIRM|nr:SWIM zinc finger family protein [Desulfoscipio gibsoniae]AGL03487.1 SWIM zinc finger-containing protein [Desulfoscipio gibsoniae DSM 7213]